MDTRLGIKAGFLAALTFVTTYISIWAGVALMIFILVYEINKDLRKNAVQAVALGLVFVVLMYSLAKIEQLFGLSIGRGDISIEDGFDYSFFYGMRNLIGKPFTFIYDSLGLIQILSFGYYAFAVLKNNKVVSIPIASKIAESALGERTATQSVVSTQSVVPAQNTAPTQATAPSQVKENTHEDK